MPQPQDNTMGAPTEGLGQTVTFASGGGNRPPQMPVVHRQMVRDNASGGGAQLTSRAMSVPDAQPDPTFSILAKLGGEIIKPHIEAEKTAAFVRGMQQAAQGQAITEIVDEQPWYSKLFGSTSLVDGARAYTASTKAAAMAADMEANMHELQKMDGAQFSQYAAAQLLGAKTGDDVTDMMVAQQVSSTLPSVMKGQAKAHLRYNQQVLEDRIVSSADEKLRLVKETADASRKPGATKDIDDALGTFIQEGMNVLAKPAEIDKDLHDKLLATSFVKAIGNGNFDAYRIAKDGGYLASANPAYAEHVERAYQQASNHAKLNISPDMLKKLARFESLAIDPATTEDAILKVRAELNAEYTQESGDPGALIGAASTVAELRQLAAAQNARALHLENQIKAARTAEERELAKVANIENIAARLVTGDGMNPQLMLGMTSETQQDVYDHLRIKASDAVRRKIQVANVDVAIDKVERDSIESAVSTAKQAGNAGLLYRVYKERYLPLVLAAGDNSEAVAQQYAGKYAKELATYHSMARGQEIPADYQGIIYSEVVNPTPKLLPPSKRHDKIVSELTTNWFMGMFKTGVKNPAGLAAVLEPRMKSYLSTKDAIADAKLQMPNLNVVGGYHWVKNSTASSLKGWLGDPHNFKVDGVVPANEGKLDSAMERTVEVHSDLAGIASGLRVYQVNDTPTKEPQFAVIGLGSDGKSKLGYFKASDIQMALKPVDLSTVDTTVLDTRQLGQSPLEQALATKKAHSKTK